MARILLIFLLVFVLVLGASVGFFNAQPVRFDYLLGELELPLIALIIGVFLLAALVTGVVMFWRMLGLSAEVRKLRRQLRDAEAELRSLRNLPVEAAATRDPGLGTREKPAIPAPQ